MPTPPTAHRPLRALIALTRCGIGAAALTQPATLTRLLGYDSTTADRLTWLTRLAGIRDLTLGGGLLAALTRGDDGTDWLIAGALADTADAVLFTTAGARREIAPIPAAASVLAAGGGAGLAALALRPPTRYRDDPDIPDV
jgi:hypothetical protein